MTTLLKLICNCKTTIRTLHSSKKLLSVSKQTEADARQAKVLAKGLPKKRPIDDVKKIVLVASGKGGVGKSTVSVNLAVALKHVNPENNIGLLDCDVFGPSIPHMMNLNEQPLLNDEKMMIPLVNYGIKCMSMGFLVAEGAPLIWRGLMVMQALENLLRKVFWGDIDVLVVDTPPGTGDTLLSLVQNLPIAGVVLVTTPQQVAVQVARRGAKMFEKLNVPLIGIVENMSFVKCPACKSEVSLFGRGTEVLTQEFKVDILQKIPLLDSINESAEKGVPVVIENAKSDASLAYKKLAKDVEGFLNKNNG